MFCGFLIFISNIGNTESYVHSKRKSRSAFLKKKHCGFFVCCCVYGLPSLYLKSL